MLFYRFPSANPQLKFSPKFYNGLIITKGPFIRPKTRNMISHLSPLNQLSALFGVLNVKWFGSSYSTFFGYLLHVPLALILIVYKIYHNVTVLTNSQLENVRAIILFLVAIYGIPDMLCVQFHLYALKKNGVKFLSYLNDVQLKTYPRLYPRYLTIFGIFYPFCFMTIPYLILEWNVEGGIQSVYTASTYLIIMQFCTHLELIRAEMKEGLPLSYSSVMDSVDRHMGQMRVAQWTNQMFSKQLLILSARIMIYNIVNIYFILYHLSLQEWWQVYVMVNYIIFEVYILMIVTKICNGIIRQEKEYNKQLFKLIRQNSDLCENEKIKLYVQSHKGVEFTACGFFKIDYPLVTSVIAASMTYLIVLIQLS